MIRIAILGAGRIAGTMATTLRMMNDAGDNSACLYAVAARDLDRAKAFAQTYGAQKAYGSYDEMLRDPDVDLVYVATPHSHHAEHMRMCIEHGRAILCEKAFTATAPQAEEILALARKKGVLVTEAIWTRYQPMRRLIYDTAFSGIVGAPRVIQANLSYAISHKPRLVDPALAGGALLDVGVYAINFAEILFGQPDAAFGHATLLPSGVDDTDGIMLTWKDGRAAILSAGATSISEREGVIWCERGFIRVENINNPERLTVYNADRAVVQVIERPAQLTGYEYEVREAAETLAKGALECPSMPHAETLHIMRLMDDLRAQMGVRYPFE